MDPSGTYTAFFVAMHQEQAQQAVDQLLLYSPGTYLVCGEIAQNSHKEFLGFHLHYFCDITEAQYRAYITKLKHLGFTMRGRAEPNKPRTYGKVKQIRSPERMAAYTLKNSIDKNPNGAILWTNIGDENIQNLMKISFVKEEKEEINDIFLWIKENLPLEAARIEKLNEQNTIKEIPYQMFEQNSQLKVCILRYFRKFPELKFPTRNRVNYIAARYCLYESDWDLDFIAYYFYR